MLSTDDRRQTTDDRRQTTDDRRQTGIELLRIIAMLMIVGLHYLLFGGALYKSVGINQKLAWLLEAFFFVAVNCYVLISGYFLVTKKNLHISRVFSLWLQVAFYSVLFYAGYFIIHPEMQFHWKDLFHVLFPIRYEAYWFVTAYFGMYLLSPFLAQFARSMAQKEYLKFLCITTLLFSFYSFFSPESDPFKVQGGYSTFWLIVIFFWGGYIRLWNVSFDKTKVWMIYIIACLCTFVSSWPVHWILTKEGYKVGRFGLNGFYNYNSPTVLLASLMLFFLFYKMKIGNQCIRNIVLWMGPLTFGVYLIHMNQYVARELWGHWIHVDSAYTNHVSYFLFHMFITIIGVFIVCIFLDMLRRKLFQWLLPVGMKMIDPVVSRLLEKFGKWKFNF